MVLRRAVVFDSETHRQAITIQKLQVGCRLRPLCNFRRAGDNFRRAGYNFRRAGDNFRRAGDNFRRAGDNFRRAGDNFRRAGDNFRRTALSSRAKVSIRDDFRAGTLL